MYDLLLFMNTTLFQNLLELHKSIVDHAIRASGRKTNLPLFSYQAPGHIGVDNIEAPNLDLNFESLPTEYQDKIISIFSTDGICKQFSLHSASFNIGLIESFLSSVRIIYLLSIVKNPTNRYNEFLTQASLNSKSIAEWIETGTHSKSINIIIQPNLNIAPSQLIGDWSIKNMSIPELCIEGYLGFQSPQEACERVFASSFLKRDLNTLPKTSSEILAEVDILVISLWLALGNIYRIQDIRFENNPWSFSPDESSPFGIKFQLFWDNTRENQQLQTFVRLNMKRPSSFLTPQTSDFIKVSSWMKILSCNRKAIYSFNIICDGVRDIAKSVSEQSFRKERMARDGIFKIISGLEGLNTDCKPIDKNGYKTKATFTFVSCWAVIWRKSMINKLSLDILSKANNIEDALTDIYNLRSDLAHSDPTSMHSSLERVKKSCGDLFNPNQYDPTSVGLVIVMITDELLNFFYDNENVLTDMLSGKKPYF